MHDRNTVECCIVHGGSRRDDRVDTVTAAAAVSRLAVPIEEKPPPPRTPTTALSRTALVNRLRGARDATVISIAAPAGYGKTTLLSQWAGRDERRFASLSLTFCGGDPATLLWCIADALDRLDPLDPSVVDALQSARKPIWSSCLPSLAAALSERSEPIVLALDDVGHVRSKACADVLAVLSDHVPNGSCLALAGRYGPLPLVARARARGLLFELGPDQLAFSAHDARLLFEAESIALGEGQELELLRKTEGWPAGLTLAAASIREANGSTDWLDAFGGDDRFVADYLRHECLSELRPKERLFLKRSSVLNRLSAAACDAVLERDDSARVLDTLERECLFLVPLDHRRKWFRYNRLFRELLHAELMRDEPRLVRELNRRAAGWCEENGFLSEGIEHAQAAHDRGRVARLVAVAVHPDSCGSTAKAEEWFGRVDDPGLLSEYPAVAVFGSLHHALRGRPLAARRWAESATGAELSGALPDGSRSIEPWLHVLRAARCQHGVAQMRNDAQSALDELPYDSIWIGFALVTLGAAQLLAGDNSDADITFADACTAADAVGDPQARLVAFAERSLLASDRGDFETAERLAHAAGSVADEFELETHTMSAIALAASARVALRLGDSRRVEADLGQSEAFVPLLTHAIPWFSVQSLLELAQTRLAIGDLDRGRALIDQAHEIIRCSSDLGTLVEFSACLEARTDALADVQSLSLTAAELRLLPYLATHLSFSEIGGVLYLSRNTIKSHVSAIYRKLGASSRSDAIARAADLRLVEHPRLPLVGALPQARASRSD